MRRQQSKGLDVSKDGDALDHLGNVLYMLADLHPDDHCDALDEALEFYNRNRPNFRVEPSGMAFQRLKTEWPEEPSPAK